MGVDSVLVRKDNASYESLADSQSVQAIATNKTHSKNHDDIAKSSPHGSNPVFTTITPTTTTTTTASSTITSYDIIDHCSITPNQSMITESFLTEHSSDGSIQKPTENTSLNDSHVVTPNRFSCPEQGPTCTSDTLATDDRLGLSSTHRKFLSLIDPTTYKAINRFGQLCSFTLNLDWDSSDKQSALTEYDSESIPSSSKFSCDAFAHSSDVLSRTTENGEPEQTGSLYDSSSIDGSYGDVNRGSEEHHTTDDCSKITLADYLDSLNHGSSTRKPLKPIPQLAHVKKMSSIPSPTSAVADETENGPTVDKLLMHDTPNAPPSPLTNETNSESGINLPRPPSTSVDYLLKRRAFLLDRLAVRYTELLCLMNEELELTGHPPENYLQCINAYHEAQEAIKHLRPPAQDRDAKNSKPETTTEDSSNNIDSRASVSSRHRASNPGLPLPNALRGNRLQETGFLLSPKAFRKASLKVSPSVTSLIRGSRLSLNNEDQENCTDDGPIQKRPPLNQSMTNLRQRSKSSTKNTHLITDRTTVEDKRSWIKDKFARDSHTPQESVQTERPKCPRSKISLSMSELTSSSSTPSLRDFGKGEKPEEQRTSDLQDGGTTRRQSSQTSVYESEVKDLDEKDRSQAIAWIDMELSAVRNILEANQLCAKERCRTRESRKAYKLAARKNEETIAKLERQKEALQTGTLTETEDSSVDGYATSTPDGSSVCSANPSLGQLTNGSIHSSDDKEPLGNGCMKSRILKYTGRASNCVCSIGRRKPPLQGMYDGLSRALGLHRPPSQDSHDSPRSHSRSVSPECPSAGSRTEEPIRYSQGKQSSLCSTPPPSSGKQNERVNGTDSSRNTLKNRTDTDLSSSIPQAASTPNRRHLVRPQCVGDPPLSAPATSLQYETSSDTGLGTSVTKTVNRDTDSDPGRWNGTSGGTKSVSSTELCEPSVRYVSPNPINHYWCTKPDTNNCRVIRVPCQPRRSIPSSASAAAFISVTQTNGQPTPNASVDNPGSDFARMRRLNNQDKVTTRSPTYPNYSTVQYRHSPTPENRSPQLPQITTLYATVLPRSSNRSNSPVSMVKSPLVDQPCSTNGASPLSAMGTDRFFASPSHYAHSRRIPSSESMDTFARGRIGSDPYYKDERIYQTASKYGVRPGSRTPDPGAFSRRPVQIVSVGQSTFCGSSRTSSPSGSNYETQSDAKILYPRNQNSLQSNHFGPTGDVYQTSSGPQSSSGLACSSYWIGDLWRM